MQTKTLKSYYIAMTILEEPVLLGPIIILALSKLGHMTTEQIFLSETIMAFLVLILDAPTAILADLVGRKVCVIFGKASLLVGIIVITFMSTPLMGFIGNLFWGISIALSSGAEEAMLYDEFARRGTSKTYNETLREMASYRAIIAGIATLASGYIAEYDLRLPFMLSVPGIFISFVMIFFFPKETQREKSFSWEKYKKSSITSMQEVLGNSTLRSLIIWFALFGVIGKVYFFTYNPYLDLAEVKSSTVGIIFFGINMMMFVSSRYAFVIQEKVQHHGLRIGFMLQGVCMVVQSLFVSLYSGLLICLQGVSRGYVQVIKSPLLNKEIQEEHRASIISFQSSFEGVLQMTALFLASFLANDITTLLFLLGVVTCGFAFFSKRW